MGKPKIEWTDATWNPVTGCTPISPGCANCYAKRMSKRLAGRGGYPADDPFRVTLHMDKQDEPLKWKKPRRVFVCSMGDLFHKDVPTKFIIDCLSIMAEGYQHTFMLLTKRPKRMMEILSHSTVACDTWLQTSRGVNAEPAPWPLPNVWIGVTAENQEQANKRIPILLQTPAVVRFVSVEPMLGPVSFRWALWEPMKPNSINNQYDGLRRLDWIICGGETGPGARPMHPDWVRSLRDQCQEAGVPFFFKQWGEWTARCPQSISLANREMAFRHGTTFYKVGKKAAGRLLDSVEWSQYPEVR